MGDNAGNPTTERGTISDSGTPRSSDRIKEVRATPVNIPLEAPFLWSPGAYPGFSKVIIEVETEDGVLGIGEAPSPSAVSIIEDELAPALVGADPVDLADCERRCLSPIRAKNVEDLGAVRAYGGIEMALWDVRGHIEERSIASLLGGGVRNTARFSEYFAFRLESNGRGGEDTPQAVAQYCARMVEEHGACFFEGKVGAKDTKTDLAMVRAVREAIGEDTPLRVDVNMGWSLTTARDMLRRLESLNVRSVEEPVRTAFELAKLRPATSIGLSSHDTNLAQAVALGVPDAIVINLTSLGGIRRSLSFIAACEELGIEVWFYSPDTGVANAAYLQVVAAVDWVSEPSQTLLRWHLDDVIAEGPFRPKEGALDVPLGPGLGVNLDRQALTRCHQRFVEEGPYDHYQNPTQHTFRVKPFEKAH